MAPCSSLENLVDRPCVYLRNGSFQKCLGLPAPHARPYVHAPLLPKDGWALVINQKGNVFCSHFFLQKSPNNILLACHVNTNRQADTFKDFFFFYKDSSDQPLVWVRRHLRGGGPASHTYARCLKRTSLICEQ